MQKYIVEAKCGHVGKGKYVSKRFPIEADNGREAAEMIRLMPRVKHDKKDAIINVIMVDEEHFQSCLASYKEDPYFRCKNKQEQKRSCPDMVIHMEPEQGNKKREREVHEPRMFHKQRIRNYKKYMTRYLPQEEYWRDREDRWIQ